MKKQKECVIANEVKQSKMRMGLLRHYVPRNDVCKKKAFTLAEVLITLGIIGVVAAMTIPTLMQKTNDKELVSGTLKMGTTLSNALKSMEAHDMVGVDKLADLSTFDSKFKAQLKTRNCSDHSVCLADGSYFDYTEDGFGGVCDKETPCVKINADINGRKGPNKAGKDQYTFLVTYKGIVPMGETETCSGLDCTAYVLAHHKLWEGETTQSTQQPQQTTPTRDACLNKSSGNFAGMTDDQLHQLESLLDLEFVCNQSDVSCYSYIKDGDDLFCQDENGYFKEVELNTDCSVEGSFTDYDRQAVCSNGRWTSLED